MDESRSALMAIGAFAVFTVTNEARQHGKFTEEQAMNALVQAGKEAVFGHPKARRSSKQYGKKAEVRVKKRMKRAKAEEKGEGKRGNGKGDKQNKVEPPWQVMKKRKGGKGKNSSSVSNARLKESSGPPCEQISNCNISVAQHRANFADARDGYAILPAMGVQLSNKKKAKEAKGTRKGRGKGKGKKVKYKGKTGSIEPPWQVMRKDRGGKGKGDGLVASVGPR